MVWLVIAMAIIAYLYYILHMRDEALYVVGLSVAGLAFLVNVVYAATAHEERVQTYPITSTIQKKEVSQHLSYAFEAGGQSWVLPLNYDVKVDVAEGPRRLEVHYPVKPPLWKTFMNTDQYIHYEIKVPMS